MKTLDRYLLRELAGPLAFGMLTFTGLFLGGDLVSLAQQAVELGASVGTVGRLVLLRLPQLLVWTLPMAVLLGVLLSLSRLSATSEVVAMRASGLSFLRLVAPVLGTGVLVTCLALFISEAVVPITNMGYTRVLVEDLRGGRLPSLTRNVILKEYHQGLLQGFLYAATFDSQNQVMQGVTIVGLDGGRPVRTTYAERVVWDQGTWLMEDGVTHYYQEPDRWVQLDFRGSRQPVEIGYRPEQIPRLQKSPEEMSIRELREHVDILRAQGEEVRTHLVQLHLKVAIPVASLVFALVAAPLGVQPHRSATSVGFGMSMALIFVYYLIMTLGTALAQGGQLPPALGAWLQNIVVGGAGVALTWRAGTR